MRGFFYFCFFKSPTMNFELKQELYTYLCSFATTNKCDLIEKNIQYRTRHITIVLEDIFQPQNASAVLRSCDCLGIHDIHIIEKENKFQAIPEISMGSSKWVNTIHYRRDENNISFVYNKLRANGYRIIATTPHKHDLLIEDLPIDQKTALVFGTELDGLSEKAINQADGWVRIPMYGFTESYNISVSAAISLFHLSEKLRKTPINWQLSEEEALDIKLEWIKKVVKASSNIEKAFWAKKLIHNNL